MTAGQTISKIVMLVHPFFTLRQIPDVDAQVYYTKFTRKNTSFFLDFGETR